ncbi:MAG TPA: tetratricopeptide repeat protein [Candidatus Binatia bacterium]|jgi:lipoprotein NlpI
MRLSTALLVMLLALVEPAWAQWNEDAQNCFEYTKPETMNADRAMPFCNRAIQSGELNRNNLATIYYYRGTIYMSKKDYKRAIPEFDEAVRLDPTLAQGFNTRGFARFFLGDFKPAVTDFTRAVQERPADLYALLWRYIVQAKTGGDGAADLERATRQMDLAEWPGPLVLMYRGQAKQQDVLRPLADVQNPKTQREKKCEFYFYAGQQLLIQGKKSEAIKMLRAAVATNVTNFPEYEGAKTELKRLGA